jgi:hypothetical protein
MRVRTPNGGCEWRDCTAEEDAEIQKVDDLLCAVAGWAMFIASAAAVAAIVRLVVR